MGQARGQKVESLLVASLSPSPTRSHGEHRALASSGLRLISLRPASPATAQSRTSTSQVRPCSPSPSPDPRSSLHARTPDELDDGAFDGNDDYYGASPPSIDPCVRVHTDPALSSHVEQKI